MSTNTQQIEKTPLVLVPGKDKLYQVRENLTVWIGQRNRLNNGEIDEAQALFERKGEPNKHGYSRMHEVVINLPELQQMASLCGFPQPKQIEWPNMFEPSQPAPNATWKQYKIRDCGMKFNLDIYDNQRLELEYKYYKGDPYATLTLEIGDVLAVLDLISLDEPPFVLERKKFKVGEHEVLVLRQDKPWEEKPHQVMIQVEIGGIIRTETDEYPAALIANRDEKYAYFDQEHAEKVVAKFQRFIANPPKAFEV